MRIFLTIGSLAAYWFALATVNLFYSPLTGIATAKQLDDSVESYAFSKFVRDGGFQAALFWLVFVFLLLVWLQPILNQIKNRSNEKPE